MSKEPTYLAWRGFLALVCTRSLCSWCHTAMLTNGISSRFPEVLVAFGKDVEYLHNTLQPMSATKRKPSCHFLKLLLQNFSLTFWSKALFCPLCKDHFVPKPIPRSFAVLVPIPSWVYLLDWILFHRGKPDNRTVISSAVVTCIADPTPFDSLEPRVKIVLAQKNVSSSFSAASGDELMPNADWLPLPAMNWDRKLIGYFHTNRKLCRSLSSNVCGGSPLTSTYRQSTKKIVKGGEG